MKLDNAVTIADLRRMAKRRLPPPVFDLIEGGAGDEISMRRNTEAFERVAFRPRPLTGITHRDLSTTVLGQRVALPVLLAPTGAARIADRRAELAVAEAACRADTLYVQSTVTGYPLENVAAAADRPLWFQLYMPPTAQETRALLARVERAGYSTLVLTIDTPLLGNRERDVRNRVTIPARITPKLVLQGATRPRWSWEFLRTTVMSRGSRDKPRPVSSATTQNQIIATQWPVGRDDLRLVRELWKGPLVVKGVMRGDECAELAELGVDAVVVSNHGGRQLDNTPGTLDVLPEVVAATGGRMTVLFDGGVRRGADVARAIALGATAVLIGRPYLYGLAAAGGDGVGAALAMLTNELDRTMALLGAATIADITADLVTRAPC